jgi:uncharacterized membrane protein
MPTPEKQRKKDLVTMITLAGALLAVCLLFKIRLLLAPAVLLLMIAAAMPALSARIAELWRRFSVFIGHINSRVLLTGIYYLVLTPVALLSRLFSKDPLTLKKRLTGDGYWHERNKTFTREDFEKTW